LYCCIDCFSNEYLKEEVRSQKERGACDYCDAVGETWVASVSVVGQFVRDCMSKAYVNATTDDIPYWMLKNYATSINDILRFDESIFSEYLDQTNNVDRLLKDLFKESGPSYRDIAQGDVDEWEGGEAEVALREAFYGPDHNLFIYTWGEFKYTVKHVNRFFDVGKGQTREEMLSEFDPIITAMSFELPVSAPIWRARLNPKGSYNTKGDQTNECGPPPRNMAKPFRMNPAGISYFYGAENKETCRKEIRAKNEDLVIYGLFLTKKPIKIVDLSEAPWVPVPSIFSPKYNHELNWAKYFLMSFSDEISKPVMEEESAIEYIPTQILTEYIRLIGYDGVRYKSSLTDGYNYAIFCGQTEIKLETDIWGNIKHTNPLPEFTDWLEFYHFEVEPPR
jgi:hypothetical protein